MSSNGAFFMAKLSNDGAAAVPLDPGLHPVHRVGRCLYSPVGNLTHARAAEEAADRVRATAALSPAAVIGRS